MQDKLMKIYLENRPFWIPMTNLNDLDDKIASWITKYSYLANKDYEYNYCNPTRPIPIWYKKCKCCGVFERDYLHNGKPVFNYTIYLKEII